MANSEVCTLYYDTTTVKIKLSHMISYELNEYMLWILPSLSSLLLLILIC